MPLPSIFIITAGPNDLAGLIEAPVNGIYDYFGVEIRRDRNE